MQRFFKHNKNIIISLLAFFILLIAAIETLQAQKLPDLIPYRKGDLWGFADSNRKIIIPVQFDKIAEYDSVGAIVVIKGKGSAYINKQGKEIIPFGKYAYFNFATEGMISVAVRNGNGKYGNELFKCGLYNRQGELKIPIEFPKLEWPSEGICLYRDKDNRVGYVDTNGKVILTAKYIQGNAFHSGRAVVDRGTYFGCTMGYIDRNGKEIIPATNAFCDDFFKGMAQVKRCNGKQDLIDTSGNIISTGSLAVIVQDKLTRVRYNNKYGYMDSSNKMVIPPVYVEAEPFHNGFAVVTDTTWKKGLINEKGKVVIPFKYRYIEPVDSGSVIVGNNFKEGNRYGLLDTQDNVILPLEYGRITPMSEGLISACKNGICGYYDLKGAIVIPLQYTQADKFKNGMARVYLNNKSAIINRKGNYIIPFKYDGLSGFNKGISKAWLKDKEFYIDKYGNEYYEEE